MEISSEILRGVRKDLNGERKGRERKGEAEAIVGNPEIVKHVLFTCPEIWDVHAINFFYQAFMIGNPMMINAYYMISLGRERQDHERGEPKAPV